MKWRLMVILVFMVLIGGAAVVAQQYLTWDELIAHEANLREAIISHPIRSVLIGFATYTLICFVPGTTGKSLVLGWLYGVWVGVAIVNTGLTLAAMATFFASRYVLRDVVQARLGYQLHRVDNAVQRDGGCYLFMLRMMHAPYSVTNYICGATSLRATTFWWATQLGMLPGNIVFVYAGASVPSLKQLADKGIGGVFSWQLVIALGLLSVVPILLRYVATRWRSLRVSRQA